MGTPEDPLWTRPYTLTLAATFFIFIPYALFLPVLPVYILEDLHGSFAEAGAVNAVFLVASVLFRSQTARLESRFGKRSVLLVAGFLFMLSTFLYLLVESMMGVMIIRFFSGICFAVVNTCLYTLGSQLTPSRRKGEGLAYLATVVTAGTAIGPFVGLSMARTYGYGWVFFASGLVALVGFLLSLRIVIPKTILEEQATGPRFSLRELFEARALPASGIVLLLAFAISPVLSFASVYANSMHLTKTAAYFFVVMALSNIGSRLFTGRIYDRFGANVVIYPAIFSLACGLFILGKAEGPPGMFAAAALVGIAYGIIVPAIQTLAIQQSPSHRTSVATATFFTFFDIGMGAGSYLLGACIPFTGFSNLFLLLTPFVLSISVIYYALHGRKVIVPEVCNRRVD